MTAQEIVGRYLSGPRTDERLDKAKALADRMHVPWKLVVILIRKGEE